MCVRVFECIITPPNVLLMFSLVYLQPKTEKEQLPSKSRISKQLLYMYVCVYSAGEYALPEEMLLK